MKTRSTVKKSTRPNQSKVTIGETIERLRTIIATERKNGVRGEAGRNALANFTNGYIACLRERRLMRNTEASKANNEVVAWIRSLSL